MSSVKAFICTSGKRKTGKDFTTRILASHIARRLPNVSVSICTLSDPLKDEFAHLRGIEASQLKGDGPTKELVREEMITFGERLRSRDPGYFCRKAFTQRKLLYGPQESSMPEVVLVSDCRRSSDITFFRGQFPSTSIICVRIECPLEVRQQRGFVFKSGVDDAESECALDTFGNWDFVVQNEGRRLKDQFDQLVTNLERQIGNLCFQNRECVDNIGGDNVINN